MTVALVAAVVRLVFELTKHVHHGMAGRHSPPASRAMSTLTTEKSQTRSGLASSSRTHQLDVDLATVDLHIDYLTYAPFLPRFVDVDDRRVFIGDDDNRVYLTVPPDTASQLLGRVRVVWNGVIRPGHECSWKTSDEEFSRQGDGGRSTTYVNQTLCPLLVPDGHTFQHFVDGVLPKLVQLLTDAPRLATAVDRFVVYRPRDAVIYELLERLGITRQRLMLVTRRTWQVLEVRHLVDTCVTPSVHPQLWRRASQLLRACSSDVQQPAPHCPFDEVEQNTSMQDPDGQHKTLGDKTGDIRRHIGSKTVNSSLIILLSRRWTRNAGRRLLNENAVLVYLTARFGRQRVARFGNGRVDLTTAQRLFSRAAAVVGVHGGAFYNIILAPPSCHVVEVMPLVAGSGQLPAPPRRLAHTVVWRMADALGHMYWRLYASTSSTRSDVTLPIDKLRSVLSAVT